MVRDDDGKATIRVADMHVGDVDTEEDRTQASAFPEIIDPPENVVLKIVVAGHTEAAQGRHAFECQLEIQDVVLVECTVVYVEVYKL